MDASRGTEGRRSLHLQVGRQCSLVQWPPDTTSETPSASVCREDPVCLQCGSINDILSHLHNLDLMDETAPPTKFFGALS